MTRIITLLAAGLLTLGLLAGPVLAHPHHMQTPGTCVDLPTEPDVIHHGDPSNGNGIKDRGPGWEDELHPMHHVLHRGELGDRGWVDSGGCP
jgi:hypothetical protein